MKRTQDLSAFRSFFGRSYGLILFRDLLTYNNLFRIKKKLMKEFFLYFAGKKNWICSPKTEENSTICEMAASTSDPKCPILPREMWLYVWGFLDFNTLQRSCTRVSKQWLKEIRN